MIPETDENTNGSVQKSSFPGVGSICSLDASNLAEGATLKTWVKGRSKPRALALDPDYK